VKLDRFLLASLATWRVTHLLAEEDGPADVVVRLRARLGDRAVGRLTDCFHCLSVWVAAPMSVGLGPPGRVDPIAWLALTGAACLLERATERGAHYPTPSPGPEENQEATIYELLRAVA
jgi:hypothetical protein